MQQYYGIDLDAACGGRHTAAHVASLVSQLPQDARVRVAEDEGNRWTLEASLMALIFNAICAVFGGDDAPRIDLPGAEPRNNKRTIAGDAMTVEQLHAALSRPRHAAPDDVGEVD